MLIYSMGVSVDGFIADRAGGGLAQDLRACGIRWVPSGRAGFRSAPT